MGSIILADRGDENKIIEEEKQLWVYKVLLALGANEEVLGEAEDAEVREYLSALNLEIWNKYDGSIDILRGDKIVAQWKPPELILIKDKPKWYYEIHIQEWALPFQMENRGK